jgi:hypothetical protein
MSGAKSVHSGERVGRHLKRLRFLALEIAEEQDEPAHGWRCRLGAHPRAVTVACAPGEHPEDRELHGEDGERYEAVGGHPVVDGAAFQPAAEIADPLEQGVGEPAETSEQGDDSKGGKDAVSAQQLLKHPAARS